MSIVKTGLGVDAHQLAENYDLIIGGVKIESDTGSVGHSDGDALLHAIVDALLGAAGLGDIGQFFPSDDDRWKGMSSLHFLRDSADRVRKEGWEIGHIDSVVILQTPKLKDYIPQMRYQIAYTLQTDETNVSIKATTTDHLGFIGEGRGWAAQAIVTLTK
ncbi:MAG: 2-C-methyl-D-erythritol 2,4-cyclodiphosphate synthase [Candidatus Marinimicrobia bacterium]|nr:2-C-methyl-D-erythritol 2,4-cyclodiphosphate synthase [Candidatus Neomarinimicrobiota bacterium]